MRRVELPPGTWPSAAASIEHFCHAAVTATSLEPPFTAGYRRSNAWTPWPSPRPPGDTLFAREIRRHRRGVDPPRGTGPPGRPSAEACAGTSACVSVRALDEHSIQPPGASSGAVRATSAPKSSSTRNTLPFRSRENVGGSSTAPSNRRPCRAKRRKVSNASPAKKSCPAPGDQVEPVEPEVFLAPIQRPAREIHAGRARTRRRRRDRKRAGVREQVQHRASPGLRPTRRRRAEPVVALIEENDPANTPPGSRPGKLSPFSRTVNGASTATPAQGTGGRWCSPRGIQRLPVHRTRARGRSGHAAIPAGVWPGRVVLREPASSEVVEVQSVEQPRHRPRRRAGAERSVWPVGAQEARGGARASEKNSSGGRRHLCVVASDTSSARLQPLVPFTVFYVRV